MSEENNAGITGSWWGNYYYSSANKAYGFEAVFVENNGALSGNILDMGTLGEATVSGTFTCPAVGFTKVYYKGGNAPVTYVGTLASDGKSMSGTWQIPPTVRGNWIAWRIDEEEGPEDLTLEEATEEEKVLEREKVPIRPIRPRTLPDR